MHNLVLGGALLEAHASYVACGRYNKQVLKVFPFPLTCTCLQFFAGSILAALSWATGLLKPPKFDKKLVSKQKLFLNVCFLHPRHILVLLGVQMLHDIAEEWPQVWH